MYSITVFVFAAVLGNPFTVSEASSKSNLNWRIVGGSKAPEGAAPYQVSIRESTGRHLCGGVIIEPTIVLTAGHCVEDLLPSTLLVFVGSNKLSTGGRTYPIDKIKVHEEFDPDTLKNDIAIIKLSESISFTTTVSNIELGTTTTGPGVSAIATGWGLLSYPGVAPDDLQYIVLKTISNSECERYHVVDDSHLCTLTQRGEGVCHGDSGGPLISKGLLIGIVSTGEPCAVAYPDVYTRVSYFIQWIKSNSV